MESKFVYNFNSKKTDGNSSMRDLLGGKGANLAEMCSIGIPVPAGFTISTEACRYYYANNHKWPDSLQIEILLSLKNIEENISAKFGSDTNPLLVSVRSGARASMPGMMDTILNLGLNDITVEALATSSNNPRFAYDSYRRFIQMYSDVVLGVDHYLFEEIIDLKKEDKNVNNDVDLDADDWKAICILYKKLVKEQTKRDFPQDVNEQLFGAVEAVFKSWMNARAKKYRELNNIPASWGTAVNIQAMVFGNMGDDSATGVAFTRDPSTGDNNFYGEYLINAQGEDVVAGIRTPQSITEADRIKNGSNLPSMEKTLPNTYKELLEISHKLENHYRDMQDIEFTIQNNKLWILQTRNGKRSAQAAIKIAVDMFNEKLLTKEEALLKVSPDSLDQLLHPTLDPKCEKKVIDVGLPASPGAATGKVVFSAEDAEWYANNAEKVILVRIETSPEDIHGMHAAQGILTTRGGMTSHAAVVARGMGKPCVCGAGGITINYHNKTIITNKGDQINEGDIITINGSTGEVIIGTVTMIQPQISGEFETIMQWADEIRVLNVRTNAETPQDTKAALQFGAEGIGLCRTEHMFFETNRIVAVREMILAQDVEGREKALAKLLPMQKDDFRQIFKLMGELPVTIRLLDPPLHEFLPRTTDDMQQIVESTGADIELLMKRSSQLHEMNPMLGHRGCRLGITYPEIYSMQAHAIFEAAIEVSKELGKNICPEVMIPLIMGEAELSKLKILIDQKAEEIFAKFNHRLDYLVGTMIELPRAALVADDIARTAQFFSFGTNDLTQTTLGISRDDAGSFLGHYKEAGLIECDPFVRIDEEGVGQLVKMAVEKGKKTNPEIKLGICGEHGGNPESVEFFHKVGLDYVSCSPYRVPIARLAAAQAQVKFNKARKFNSGYKITAVI